MYFKLNYVFIAKLFSQLFNDIYVLYPLLLTIIKTFIIFSKIKILFFLKYEKQKLPNLKGIIVFHRNTPLYSTAN